MRQRIACLAGVAARTVRSAVGLSLAGGLGVTAVALIAWLLGSSQGATAERAHAILAAEAGRQIQLARDAKIINWIVKVNPRATIKDFGGDFPDWLVRAAERKHIRFQLAMAMIEKESAWDPEAVGAKGEIGLMQMLPATARLIAQRLPGKKFEPPL